jgi:LAS superfamily LD-carboxypeptidase LdcB
MTDLKGKVVQVGSAVVLREASDMFSLLKNALKTAKGVALNLDQGYLSKFEVADQLRKTVKDKDKKPPADIKPLLDSNKPILDIIKEKQFDKLKKYLDGLSDGDFEPPLQAIWRSPSNKEVYPLPNRIEKDPRRTGNLIVPGPADVMKGTEVRKWLINNSVLYGFVMYSDKALYYLGVDKIKNDIKAAANKDAKLKEILGTFLPRNATLDGLSLTGKAVVENTIPTAVSFADPGNLEYIPSHNLTANDGQILPLVVVDDHLVWKPLGIAWLQLKKAAAAQKIDVAVFSGFRPATGTGTVRSNKGNTYTPTSQLALRKQRGRWSGRSRWKGDDNSFIYNAPANYYTEATAPPKGSKHGSGQAIDINIGKRRASRNTLRTREYVWLVKNAHKFGFIRTVPTEEWHFEYWPEYAVNGPYAKLSGTNEHLFYTDLGIAQGQFSW